MFKQKQFGSCLLWTVKCWFVKNGLLILLHMYIKLLKSGAIILCKKVIDLDENHLHENYSLYFWGICYNRDANGVWYWKYTPGM